MSERDTSAPSRAAAAPPRVGSTFRIRGLCVRYRGNDALRDVDLDVAHGRVTALIGPSGCGKTSLLHSLNRLTDLVPGCTVRGSVHFEGREVLDQAADVPALRRSIGLVFQKPNPFPVSVRANLHLPLREEGGPAGRRDELAEEVLREVGLWERVRDRLDRPALELSGGEQQRLCIARALTLRPRVLLMDEPCSALDPLSTEAIEELVRRMRGPYTIVIVTHNLAQARRLADDVAVFWFQDGAGRLVEAGPAARVFQRPREPITAAYVAGRRG